jgi:hypothetical protein
MAESKAPRTMENENEILRVIGDGPGGFTTGAIAEAVLFEFGHNRHIHSAYVRQLLLGLERQGEVKRLDDQKPVCWTRVPRTDPRSTNSGGRRG